MIVTVTITIEGITLVNHILKLEYVHNLSMVLVKKVKNVVMLMVRSNYVVERMGTLKHVFVSDILKVYVVNLRSCVGLLMVWRI